MHHWEIEYFDEYYDEKQAILKEITKENYIRTQQAFEIERKKHALNRGRCNDCVA